MARTLHTQYPVLNGHDLKKPVVFVVDMINGFVRQGALADQKIDEISVHIARLLDHLQAPVYFVADAHTPDAAEFAAYPPHCLAGSEESVICETLAGYAETVIEKNSTNTFMAPGFQPLLAAIDQYQEVIITGCCTDLCILQFVLSLKSWLNQQDLPIQIIVPENCVDTFDIEGAHDAVMWNEMALANMAANGVTVAERINF